MDATTRREAGTREPGTYADLPPELPEEFVRIFRAALPLLQTRLNDLHAKIAAQLVVELLRLDGGDPSIAVPAIILHDVGWSEIPEELQRTAFGPGSTDAALNRRHEIEGVRLAGRILEEVDYPAELVAPILRIIDRHDSHADAETLEEAIVKDADKMWRVTQLGFPANLRILQTLNRQELHDFIAVRASTWFLAPSSLGMVRGHLDARRAEFGLRPAPDVEPPAGFGTGDAEVYATALHEAPRTQARTPTPGRASGPSAPPRPEGKETHVITALVQFGLPRPLSLEKAREAFSASAPTYREVPGLVRKYYVLSPDGGTAGGMYLWRSRADAERFYTDEWKAAIGEKYGAPPAVTYFECPVVVDNLAGETIIDD